MTSLLNLPPLSGHEKMYFVYNFNQVSDAILIVMYNNKSHVWDKTFLNYEHGAWVFDKCCNYPAVNAWYKTGNSLQEIFFQHDKMVKQHFIKNQQLLSEHALMLLDACS